MPLDGTDIGTVNMYSNTRDTRSATHTMNILIRHTTDNHLPLCNVPLSSLAESDSPGCELGFEKDLMFDALIDADHAPGAMIMHWGDLTDIPHG